MCPTESIFLQQIRDETEEIDRQQMQKWEEETAFTQILA